MNEKSNLIVEVIPVTAFEQNCRVLFDDSTKKAVVFDPGGDSKKVLDFLNKNKLELQAVYLTHSHIDHCGGVAEILRARPCALYGHASEKVFRESVLLAANMYGLANYGFENCPEPEIYLSEGQEIEILGQKVQVYETPGHSPGSLSFYFKSLGIVFSGDVLFRGSIGRSDLPAGNHEQLIQSIERLIKLLPPDTKVLSGHGPDTELGLEAATNPFLI